MKKDIGIKILFIVILIGSLYFIISGLTTGEGGSNEIIETDLQLSSYNVTINVGEENTISATVLPDNATNKDVSWNSVNPNIAIVSNGTIKGISAGNTIVTARTSKANITKNINVKVVGENEPINKIEISKINVDKDKIELYVGDTAKINYSVEPENATNKKISFSTADKNVAGFNNEGSVVGVKAGTTTISLKSNNGIEAKIEITVKDREIEVTKVKISKSKVSIDKGSNTTISASVIPTNATNKEITWSSSNTKIATVDNGKINGVGVGEATITAKSANGKEATCKVTVNEPYDKPIVDNYPQYQTIESYSSDTLKYRGLVVDGHDFVLVWVKDPYKQFIAAHPQYGKKHGAQTILSECGNKGFVATNGSFFNMSNGDTVGSIAISKGKTLHYNASGGRAVILTMSKEGKLNTYYGESTEIIWNKIKADGATNTFALMTEATLRWGEKASPGSSDSTNRTLVGQIDKNNFIIYSGGGISTSQVSYIAQTKFGAQFMANLDGGGSRKLYFGKNGSPIKRFDGGRLIPDMMCFVE